MAIPETVTDDETFPARSNSESSNSTVTPSATSARFAWRAFAGSVAQSLQPDQSVPSPLALVRERTRYPPTPLAFSIPESESSAPGSQVTAATSPAPELNSTFAGEAGATWSTNQFRVVGFESRPNGSVC